MADSQRKSGNLLPTYQGNELYGVKFTILPDGKVCANGTPTREFTFTNDIPANISGDYYFSGCPSGGSYSSYDVFIWDKTTGARPKMWDGTTALVSDFGESANNQVKIVAGHETDFRIRVRQGYELKNVIFSPYLREPTSPPYYMPYSSTGWIHSLRKLTTATEAVENPLYSDGTAITAYTIKGNEEHTGTPSPQNPVMPNGVGERTAQLLDFDTWANNVYVVRGTKVVSGNSITITSTAATCFTGWNTTEYPAAARIPVTEGETIHLTWDTDADDSSSVWIFPNASATGEVHTAASNKSLDYTVPSGVDYITFRLDVATANKTITYSNIMFNSGSTAKPYEPYGYKIPISSGGVTTNIYLGSTQTIRQVKKLVLTGQENISGATQLQAGYRFSLIVPTGKLLTAQSLSICSHFKYVSDWSSLGFTFGQGDSQLFIIADIPGVNDTTTFANWLAAQYANGVPVTIWYVLATAKTATVNEPLMKIGTYADTFSNAASIPTTEGANSITVDTTVQPSEFTATWTGWHNANVKEWDGTNWE